MEIRALARCASNDGNGEVELQAGRVYDLPGNVADHLIKLGIAEVYEPPKQKRVITPQLKTTKRPVRKSVKKSGTKTDNI
jgi:hypothetical protein